MKVVMRYEKETEFTTLDVAEDKKLEDFLNKEYEERRRNADSDEVVERKTLQEVIDELFDPERGGVGNNNIRRNENQQQSHTTPASQISGEHEDDFFGIYDGFDKEGTRTLKDSNGKYKQHTLKKCMPSDGSRFKEPLMAVIENEDRQRLLEAIKKLNKKQIELLERVFVNEEHIKDIAKDEGVSESAITQRKSTALNKLKKILNKKPK